MNSILRYHHARGLRTISTYRAKPNVLVVGAGPVGLMMAYLLEQVYGIPTRIIERQEVPTTHPQAHFINLRTMEVLYSTMPAFHDQLVTHAAPSELWRDYIYTTGIGKSKEIARVDQFGSSIPRGSLTQPINLRQALSSLSPTQFLHFPQNRFETMLSAFVKESGIPIEREVELVNLVASDRKDGQTCVTLNHKRTDTIEHTDFDYVIGADGAHSRVRQMCHIEMVGTPNLQSIVNVHFTSKKLSKAAREHPGMLYFIFNQHVIGVLVAHDLTRGEWVLQIPFFPPQESITQDFSDAQCKEMIRSLLDDEEEEDIHILSVGQWQMSARVAAQYDQARRVFLVGDAAHQFPPAGGFGMNTGIQDAHNLAWKVAWHLQDTLSIDPHALLRSYERERQHVAKINTQLSLRNVERTMKVPTALHVSHNHAKLLTSIVNGSPLRFMPLSFQREMIQRVMQLGKQPLGFLNTQSTFGQHTRQQVQEIVTSRSSLGMLFYHFDIGFSYHTEAWETRARQLMTDVALQRSTEFEVAGKSQFAFSERGHIGDRIPHVWIQCGHTHQTISTVAMVDHIHHLRPSKKVQFLLVVDGETWTPSQCCCLRNQNDVVWENVCVVYISPTTSSLVDEVVDGLTSFIMKVNVHEATYTKWKQLTMQYPAILLRPDGHIGYLWEKTSFPLTSDKVQQALHHSIEIR